MSDETGVKHDPDSKGGKEGTYILTVRGQEFILTWAEVVKILNDLRGVLYC